MEEAAPDPVDLYSKSLEAFKPMSPHEYLEVQEALAESGSMAEADARKRLVEAHLTMVYQLALTFSSRNPDAGVLAPIQAGNEALLQAASEYAPTGADDGTEFQSFAQRLVDEAMRNAGGDDPSDGGLAGDREPRRPHPPEGTLGAERDRPYRLSVMLVVPGGLGLYNGARLWCGLLSVLPPVGRAGPAGVA